MALPELGSYYWASSLKRAGARSLALYCIRNLSQTIRVKQFSAMDPKRINEAPTNEGGLGRLLNQCQQWFAWRRFFGSHDRLSDGFLGRFNSFREAHQFASRHTDHVECSDAHINWQNSNLSPSSDKSVAMSRLEAIARPGMRVARLGGRPVADSFGLNQVLWTELPFQTRGPPSIRTGFSSIVISDVLFAQAEVPYLYNDLYAELLNHDARPVHLLFEGLAFTDVEPFVTLHKVNGDFSPCRIENSQQLIARLSGLGYQLKKRWRSSAVDIALTPSCLIEFGHGLHFQHSGVG